MLKRINKEHALFIINLNVLDIKLEARRKFIIRKKKVEIFFDRK